MNLVSRAAFSALVLLVFGSAVGVVWARHQTRSQFVQLQQLNAERDALDLHVRRYPRRAGFGRLAADIQDICTVRHRAVDTLAHAVESLVSAPIKKRVGGDVDDAHQRRASLPCHPLQEVVHASHFICP